MSVLFFKMLKLLRNKVLRYQQRWFWDGHWCGQGPTHESPSAGVAGCTAQLGLGHQQPQSDSPQPTAPLVFPCCAPRVGARPSSSLQVLAPCAPRPAHIPGGTSACSPPRLCVFSLDLSDLHLLSMTSPPTSSQLSQLWTHTRGCLMISESPPQPQTHHQPECQRLSSSCDVISAARLLCRACPALLHKPSCLPALTGPEPWPTHASPRAPAALCCPAPSFPLPGRRPPLCLSNGQHALRDVSY